MTNNNDNDDGKETGSIQEYPESSRVQIEFEYE